MGLNLKKCLKWIGDNATIILTFALAVITFFYLLETRELRNIAHRSLQTDIAPKVFIADIKTERHLDIEENILVIVPICILKNIGKTEAKQVEIRSEIISNPKESPSFHQLKPGTIIYPSQEINFVTGIDGLRINEEYIDYAKKIVNEKLDFINLYWLPGIFKDHALMKIKLKYIDHENEVQEFYYKANYHVGINTWSWINVEVEEKDKFFIIDQILKDIKKEIKK